MSNTPSSAWYALRRALPVWRFDAMLAEMVAQLPNYGVDEVMVMVDAEECFHGHPTPDMAAKQSGDLRRIKAALKQVGIAYSLNPWITRGHADRGRVAADTVPGIQTVVGVDGEATTCIACFLSPAWRENFAKVWAHYAATGPRVLWLEDDFRDFGDHACFCPLHLARFGALIGQTASREEVVAALYQPGPPHPWRAKWLAMQAQAALEVVTLARETVERVSPETTLGLMSSGPRNHVREGRNWQAVAQAMGATPDRPVYSRPCLGNYWEWSPPRGLYVSQDFIKLTRHCLPPGTLDMTEVESVPFSRYAKSVAFMNATLAVSFAFGARGATLNIFDHLGSLMEEEPHYGRALAAQKPFLNALATKAQLPGILRGVQLLFDPECASRMHVPQGGQPGDLAAEGFQGMEAFEAAGIPTTYDTSEVVFVCGQQPRSLSDDAIKSLLAKGVFVDATAAALLCARGFGAHLGLASMAKPQSLAQLGAFAAESLTHPDFGGAPNQYMSAQLPQVSYTALFGVMVPLPGAQVIGHLVNPDVQPVHPAMSVFENALGGRVVVHGWDYASSIGPLGVSFHHPLRQKQLQHVVRWLFRDQAPIMVCGDGAWPLALRKDSSSGILTGLINLSLDPWPQARFDLHVPQKARAVHWLGLDGQWQPLEQTHWRQEGQHLRLDAPRSVGLEQPMFFWVEWG